MKVKKLAPVMRGLAALMACLLVLSTIGTGLSDTYRTALDDVLGTQSFVVNTDPDAKISEVADEFIVGDANLILKELERIL